MANLKKKMNKLFGDEELSAKLEHLQFGNIVQRKVEDNEIFKIHFSFLSQDQEIHEEYVNFLLEKFNFKVEASDKLKNISFVDFMCQLSDILDQLGLNVKFADVDDDSFTWMDDSIAGVVQNLLNYPVEINDNDIVVYLPVHTLGVFEIPHTESRILCSIRLSEVKTDIIDMIQYNLKESKSYLFRKLSRDYADNLREKLNKYYENTLFNVPRGLTKEEFNDIIKNIDIYLRYCSSRDPRIFVTEDVLQNCKQQFLDYFDKITY